MPQISAAGHRLEYVWVNGGISRARPTLVFLHEGLGSIRQWRDFPEKVAKATGCRALVYDRYGYGNSEVLKEGRVGVEFMHDGALNELPEVLENLEIENPILIGHSDGGSIALIHAGTYEVRGVVTMAAHVFIEDICTASIGIAARDFETSGLKAGLAKYHRDASKTFHLWADAWLDPAFRKWNIEEYLPRLKCPVLAIQGEKDEYGTVAQLDAIKSQAGGGVEVLLLPDCGHAPFKDQPDKVLNAVVKFVQGLL